MYNAVKYLVAFVLLVHTTEALKSTARLSQPLNRGSSNVALNTVSTWNGGAMKAKTVYYICRPRTARNPQGQAQRFSSGIIVWTETNTAGGMNFPQVDYKFDRLSTRSDPPLTDVSVHIAFGIAG